VSRKDALPQNLGFRTDEKLVLGVSLCVVSEKRKIGRGMPETSI
jgi:hypothetical protein